MAGAAMAQMMSRASIGHSPFVELVSAGLGPSIMALIVAGLNGRPSPFSRLACSLPFPLLRY